VDLFCPWDGLRSIDWSGAGPQGWAGAALVDGRIGAVVAPNGQLRLILAIEIRDGRVAGYEVIAEPDRRESVEIAVL